MYPALGQLPWHRARLHYCPMCFMNAYDCLLGPRLTIKRCRVLLRRTNKLFDKNEKLNCCSPACVCDEKRNIAAYLSTHSGDQ